MINFWLIYLQATVRESGRSLDSPHSPIPCGASWQTQRTSLWILCKIVLRILHTFYPCFGTNYNNFEDSLSFCRYDHSSSVEVLRPSVSPQVTIFTILAKLLPNLRFANIGHSYHISSTLSIPQNIVFWRGLYCRFEVGTQPREPVIDLLTLTQLHTAR